MKGTFDVFPETEDNEDKDHRLMLDMVQESNDKKKLK